MSWRRAMSMAGRLAVRGRAGGLNARRAGVGRARRPAVAQSSSESLQPDAATTATSRRCASAATASSMEVLKPRLQLALFKSWPSVLLPGVLLVSEQRE